ncbi:MAG: type II secretion system protein GspD [Parvularculaceae bacterium]
MVIFEREMIRVINCSFSAATTLFAFFIVGCASNGSLEQAYSIDQRSVSSRIERPARQADESGVIGESAGQEESGIGPDIADRGLKMLWRVPEISRAALASSTGSESAPPAFASETVNAFVPPLALPAFIDVVFGQMLGAPYVTGQGVAARTDIVQLRSSGEMSSAQFFELVKMALAEYGVRVVADGGAYQIIEDEALKARMPQFIRTRARSETPRALRPVVQFVELHAISAGNMVNILRQAFGDRAADLRIEANPASNFVVLSGLPDDVDAALSIIDQMDELQYAGTDIMRYIPNFWDVTELSRELVNVLSAEGWQASSIVAAPRTILIVPVQFSNAMFIFTRSEDAQARVRYWLSELDRPAKAGDIPQLFVYNVQNVDAAALATTVNNVLSGGGISTQSAAQPAGGQGVATAEYVGGSAGIVVDPQGNRLIYSGTASDYERLLPLLRQLDQPPAEVLIEVTVAEIQLSDATRFGVEWVIENLGGDDIATLAQQGIGLGSGGLDFGIVSGDVRADFNAFARNSQVNVLSTPRLVARSGGAAQIQVGTDVPVITSQRAANAQDGAGVTDVLQSVEYRSTGVLLSIEPIVFGDNRVDLQVSQEVSTALPTTTADISSPTISNRNLTTTLSLEDGATAVIGGLIQDNVTDGETGIPFLKDIPGVGRLFSARSLEVDRTELVVLITAYVLRGPEDKAAFVQEFTRQINDSLAGDGGFQTVIPPRPFR